MLRGVQTVIVTGGNRGIGRAVACAMADQGWRVVVLARNAEQGRAAVDALPGEGHALVVGDLADRAGVARAADQLDAACAGLDALVHNAGIWPSRRVLNADGVEMAFAVNHLAPYQLNLLLEDRLKEGGARVVHVNAGLYVKGKVDPEVTATGGNFHSIRTYADTKLCNAALLPLFARRWENSGVTVNAVHPGVIRTGLGDRPGPLGVLLRLVKRRWAAPEEGARPVVRLATDPALDGITGRYFDVDREIPLADAARDAGLAESLWAQAARLTGAR